MSDGSRIVAATLIVAAAAPVMTGIALSFPNALFGPGISLGMAAGYVFLSLVFGFPVALVLVLTIVLPIYLTLKRWYPMLWWHAALAGAVIGALLGCINGVNFPADGVIMLIGIANGLLFRAVMGRDPRQGLPV